MKIKECKEITGGLSNPSKMPQKAFNLPASRCKVGARLKLLFGSACFGCYADKGRYRFNNVKAAMERRWEALNHTDWVAAMVHLIRKQSPDLFRWHDSGDLRDVAHLRQIVDVCELTPNTKHWLPTREYNTLRKYLIEYGNFPSNLNVRVSIHMVDDFRIPKIPNVTFSAIHDKEKPPTSAHICPAAKQGPRVVSKSGKERIEPRCHGAEFGGVDCNACWQAETQLVSYPIH